MNTETNRQKPDWPYADIVNLPHPVSKTHPRMDMIKRAAQFAPFAALTGYEDAVAETARLTDTETELDENLLEDLNRKMNWAITQKKRVKITYFVPDEKKDGGAYQEIEDVIKKTEATEIVLENGLRIPTKHVRGVSGDGSI